MSKKTLGIIGFGRFGKVLHRLFEDDFDIFVSSSSYKSGDVPGVSFCSLEETVRRSAAIFLAVPINKIAATALRIKPYLTPGKIVVDVCSVKETPSRILAETLRECGVHIWPTHPMFGPDSAKSSFEGLTWVSCENAENEAVIAPYVSFLEKKGLLVFRTTCKEHDELAAGTQGLTHLIGRYLNELNLRPTPVDTLGYKRLTAVRDQTCHDTWELFLDLMRYNRFSKDVQLALEDAMYKVASRLYDEAARRRTLIVGVHAPAGGDFDCEAVERLLAEKSVATAVNPDGRPVEIRLFDTSEAALSQNATGEIDAALVAVQNEEGSLVLSTLDEMGRCDFRAIKEFSSRGARFVLLVRRRWTPKAR